MNGKISSIILLAFLLTLPVLGLEACRQWRDLRLLRSRRCDAVWVETVIPTEPYWY